MKRAILLLSLAFLLPALLPAAADTPGEVQKSRFSGRPVPRFETLRYGKVNGRIAPDTASPLKWEYTRKGLPMRILKETQGWYFAEDPTGERVWISATQFTEAPMALTLGSFTLKAGRATDSAEVALIGKDILVELGPCEATQCSVRVGKHRGWAPRTLLWGATATNG